MATKISLDQIESNDSLQARYYKLNGSVVYDYEEQMRAGDTFPPVVLFHDGERYWLADGFHRVAAARQLGATEIDADVQEGTRRDAILYANGPANRSHGLPLTAEDKRNRVDRMLQDDEWSQWSDRKIAKHCGVSHTFVGMFRTRLAPSGNVATLERHWGLSNGMAFWKMVDKMELDKETILDQLQPGANVLTDLGMTKEECWSKVAKMAVQYLVDRFPHDSHIIHLASKRVARVTGHGAEGMGLVLGVFDLKLETNELWLVDGIARATQHEIESYLKPTPQELKEAFEHNDAQDAVEAKASEFPVGSQVKTRTHHIGTVVKVLGGIVYVETVNGTKAHHPVDLELISVENPFKVGDRVQWKDDGRGNGTIRYIKGEKCGVYADASHTTHYYHWTELEYEVVAESPAENDSEDETEISPAEDRLYMLLHNFGWKETEQLSVALEHIMLYLNGLYPFTEEIHTNVAVWREFLDRVEATCNAEHEQVAS